MGCSRPGPPPPPTLLGCSHLARHLLAEAVTHRAQDKARASQAWTYWGVAVSTQLPSTALGSGLPSHLPHRVPLPPPKDLPGACDVSWGGAHLPRFPSAVCLIKTKKNPTFCLLSFVNARVSVTAPATSTSAQEGGVHTRQTLPGRVSRSGVEEPGALSWDLPVLCGGIRR